jgi:predicted metalloprotease with PDZ domain
VFVRVLQSHGDRANGIAQETSYLAWIGPQTHFARRLEVNIAHEMLHRWIGMRLRLAGAEGSAYWFTEGFTTHFSNVIAFRSGLLSIDEFLESLNDIATRHFDDKLSTATNDELLRVTRRDQNPPIVPYTRGALYAAELDGALRSTSRGKRTLDEVVRELYRQARTTGAELPADAIRTLVRKELGQPGVDRYDAVIVQGHDPNPPSDAYGPCFARKPRVPKGFTWIRVIGIPDAQCRRW